MKPDCYVELPAGTKTGGPYVVPATTTGRKSGCYHYLTMWVGRNFNDPTKAHWQLFKQWVHIDSILLPSEVECF